MNIGDFKVSFDRRLAVYIDERIARVKSLVTVPDAIAAIEAVRTVAMTGGKRARPFMAEAMYKALGGTDSAMIDKVGLGLELFHLFCLVHDDIIDKADKRHGVPTVQVVAEETLPHAPGRDRRHLANSQALLVGDLLFAWASEAFRDAVGKNNGRDRVLRFYFQMIDDVVSGQMLDVSLMARPEAHEELIRKKMELKTATYTFVRPLQIGAALADERTDFASTIEAYGLAIGFAYQLQDDVLDIVADPVKTGKPCLNDVREGQHTLLSSYVMAHGSAADRDLFLQYFGQQMLSESVCKQLVTMMERVGVLSYAQQELTKAFAQATQIVDDSTLPAAAKRVLHDLTAYIQARTT